MRCSNKSDDFFFFFIMEAELQRRIDVRKRKVSPQIPSSVIEKSEGIDFKPPTKIYPTSHFHLPPFLPPPQLSVSLGPLGRFVTSLSYVDWDAGPELYSGSIKICWPNKSHSFGFYIYF